MVQKVFILYALWTKLTLWTIPFVEWCSKFQQNACKGSCAQCLLCLLQFFLCLCQIYDRSPFTGGGNQTHVTIPEDNLTTTALYHSATKVFIKFRMVWGCRRKIVLWYRDVGSIPAAGKRNTINTSMSINVVRLVSTNGRYTCPSWNQSMISRPLNLEENLNSV